MATSQCNDVVEDPKERLDEVFTCMKHITVVCTNLEPSEQEAKSLTKIWCVKLMDYAHAQGIISGKLNVMKTYLKARYRLSDLLRAQRNDRMTSNLKRWFENGAPAKAIWKKTSVRS